MLNPIVYDFLCHVLFTQTIYNVDEGLFMHNYIPEKRRFSGILCFRQQRSRRLRRPPRHNFVVSAITFEGFKLLVKFTMSCSEVSLEFHGDL